MNAIVFVAHCYPSGLVFHMSRMAAALYRQHAAARSGASAFYVCSHADEQYPGTWEFLRDEVPPENRIVPADYHGGLTARLHALFEKHEQVLVHCAGGHNQVGVLVPLRKAFGPRLKIVVTTHAFRVEDWRGPLVSAMQAWLYWRHADHVIFPCPYAVRKFTGSRRLFHEGRASVIPFGVEPFPSAGEAMMPAEPLGEPDIRPLLQRGDGFNLVYLAEFRAGKRHRWLVESMAPVIRENTDVKVLLLGQGRYLETVRQQIGELRLGHAMLAPGNVPRRHVPWVLGRCHCAIVASAAETFGHCYVEPMCAGLPVVGSRVGVGEHLLQDFETGLGFTCGNTPALQAALRHMVAHRTEAAQMGRLARELCTGLYSHDVVAQAHLRLYRRLLGA